MYSQHKLYDIARKLQNSYYSNTQYHINKIKVRIKKLYKIGIDESDIDTPKINKLPSNILSLLNQTNNALSIQETFERVNRCEVGDILYDIAADEPSIVGSITRLLNARIPSINFLFNELDHIQKEFSAFALDYEHQISITTSDIILEGFNFGKFRILLDIDKVGISGYDTWVDPLTPIYGDSGGSYSHPHVNEGSVCVGEGQSMITGAISSGRLVDYFHIVTNILNTYGSDGPFIAIEAWTGYTCNDCGGHYTGGEEFYCEACNVSCCSGCAMTCNVCDYYGCGNCIPNECSQCSAFNCDDCDKYCEGCNSSYCGACIISCACYEHTCKSCSNRCNVCNNITCNDCNIECNKCTNPTCTNCMEECSKCAKAMCQNCSESCSECSDQHCVSCLDKCKLENDE